jgi:hypothetical protein
MPDSTMAIAPEPVVQHPYSAADAALAFSIADLVFAIEL